MQTTNLNPSAAAPYFTPRHARTPGAPCKVDKTTPTLFTPLKIRNVTLRNRIIVSPMCQYSAAPSGPEAGHLTDYHLVTLGQYALKGAGLVFIEATSVQSNGRITPNCPGLWDESQIGPIKRIVDFVHSQGAACGIQLAHAGRKASTTAPWIASRYRSERGWGAGSIRSTEDVGGWPDDVVGPMGGMDQCWDGLGLAEEGGFFPPRALLESEIEKLVEDFGKAAARAVKAGVDLIEIHSAHGYLLHQFLSPVTNQRTDKYGGSFEGRTKLAMEVVEEIRRIIPADMPLFFRFSCTDWLEGTEVEKKFGGSWDLEDSMRLAKELFDWGIDLLDVSSGGNHKDQKTDMFADKNYQISKAARIRQEVRKLNKNLLIGAVGLITEAETAKEILQEHWNKAESPNDIGAMRAESRLAASMVEQGGEFGPMADVILVARQFLREPEWVLRVAWQLGVDVAWPSQSLRVRLP
ncbi:NADH-dependent flavin oxidoreductase-like protein [Bisporella sp. PMI_857]|nr:NADH-dependent flavin oxidoreductase-like protein [Bisporella sp. PMI_857]